MSRDSFLPTGWSAPVRQRYQVSKRAVSDTSSGQVWRSRDLTETGADLDEDADERSERSVEDVRSLGTLARTEDLYPARGVTSHAFSRAVDLLRQSIEIVDCAIKESEAGRVTAIDYEVDKLRALMPELFCCRTLGDGFGSIVVSIAAALRSPVELVSEMQLRAIRDALHLIKERPALRVERAAEEVSKLQDAGLNTTGPVFSRIADVLDE